MSREIIYPGTLIKIIGTQEEIQSIGLYPERVQSGNIYATASPFRRGESACIIGEDGSHWFVSNRWWELADSKALVWR